MTIDQLKNEDVFKLLMPKEQAWVLEYCMNGGAPDPASKKVYETLTDRSTRNMSRRLLHEPRVVTVLALWNGTLEGEPTLDQYRHELWRMARECHSDAARAALMRLYGETRGFIKKASVGAPSGIDPDLLKEIENGK